MTLLSCYLMRFIIISSNICYTHIIIPNIFYGYTYLKYRCNE